MTMSGFSGPECREIRQLLGVYVVGAIDPAERALVDEHLGQCQLCRDELAGLAGLPAMMSRVPVADVEWLDAAVTELPVLCRNPPRRCWRRCCGRCRASGQAGCGAAWWQ